MHDGSVVRFTKVPSDYDPTDRSKVAAYVQKHEKAGEIPTGLLYVDEKRGNMHDESKTSDVPLIKLPFSKLCPGKAALDRFQEDYR